VHEPLFRVAYVAYTVFVCGYSAARGEWPERLGVILCVTGSLLSVVAQMPVFAPYRNTMWGVLTIDLLVAAGFLLIGKRSGRFWPIWSLGFTLAGGFAHLARHSITTVPAARYFHTAGLWAYPAMLAILVGAYAEARRLPTAQH